MDRVERASGALPGLRSIEALIRFLMMSAPIGLHLYRADGVCIASNEVAAELLGGFPASDFNLVTVASSQSEEALTQVRAALAGETVMLPPLGLMPFPNPQPIDTVGPPSTLIPLFEGGGQLTHLVRVFLTLPSGSLEALRSGAEKELMKLFFEQSSDGIVVADMEGKILLANPEAVRQHGTPARPVAPEDWPRVYGIYSIEGTLLPMSELPMVRALRGLSVKDFRWKVRRPDGTFTILCGSTSPLYASDGRQLGALMVARDQTDRFEHEEKLRLIREQAEDHAQREEAQRALMNMVFDSMTEAVVVTDPLGNFLHINRAAREMAGADWLKPGYHIRTLDARSMDDSIMAFETSPPAQALMGQTVHNALMKMHRLDRPDEVRILSVNAAPLMSENGEVMGAVIIGRDETEAHQSAQFRDEMVGILGHDLKTPLAAIKMYTEHLVRSCALTPRQLDPVQRIGTASTRMLRMIADLLDFTRTRLGDGLPLRPQPTDLHALMVSLVSELEAAHPGRKVLVEHTGDCQGWWSGDRISQLVSNLVVNGLIYGDAQAPVRVSLRGLPNELHIAVHNEGDVIPAEQRQELFHPFRRGPMADAQSSGSRGLGLGLYIVQQIVKAHDGRIDVTSSAQQGTTFLVRLPRKNAPPEEPSPSYQI